MKDESWIGVNEILPDSGIEVLCVITVDKIKRQRVCIYTTGWDIEGFNNCGADGDFNIDIDAGKSFLKKGWYELEETIDGNYDSMWFPRNVTHWQPLPKPPIK